MLTALRSTSERERSTVGSSIHIADLALSLLLLARDARRFLIYLYIDITFPPAKTVLDREDNNSNDL